MILVLVGWDEATKYEISDGFKSFPPIIQNPSEKKKKRKGIRKIGMSASRAR